MSKAEFNEYLSSSGANVLVARAIVGLSKASAKDSSLNAAVFFRDFFSKGAKGPSLSDLSKAEKEKFSAYLKSSGATDLSTKALVTLFNESPRPDKPLAFFQGFFKAEAGDAPSPAEESPPPPAEAAAEESPPPAPEATGGEPPAEPAAEAAADPPPSLPGAEEAKSAEPAAEAAAEGVAAEPEGAAEPDPPPSPPAAEADAPPAPADAESAEQPEAAEAAEVPAVEGAAEE